MFQQCVNAMNVSKSSSFSCLNLLNTLVIKRYKNKGTSITSKPIKNHLKHLYPLKQQRDAQYNYDKKEYEEITLSQSKRAVYGKLFKYGSNIFFTLFIHSQYTGMLVCINFFLPRNN